MRLPKKLRKNYRKPNELRDSDFWETPAEAFCREFIDLLPSTLRYGEPCFGKGKLALHLTKASRLANKHIVCCHASDLYVEAEPELRSVKLDARTLTTDDLEEPIDLWITNAPWRRGHLFPIIDNLVKIAPVWMILPGEFYHRRNASACMSRCSDVVSTGCVNWIPGKSGNARTAYAWYKFHNTPQKTVLHPRYP